MGLFKRLFCNSTDVVPFVPPKDKECDDVFITQVFRNEQENESQQTHISLGDSEDKHSHISLGDSEDKHSHISLGDSKDKQAGEQDVFDVTTPIRPGAETRIIPPGESTLLKMRAGALTPLGNNAEEDMVCPIPLAFYKRPALPAITGRTATVEDVFSLDEESVRSSASSGSVFSSVYDTTPESDIDTASYTTSDDSDGTEEGLLVASGVSKKSRFFAAVAAKFRGLFVTKSGHQ